MLSVYNKKSDKCFKVSCVCNLNGNRIIRLVENLPLPLSFQENSYGYFYIAGKDKVYISQKELKQLFKGEKI